MAITLEIKPVEVNIHVVQGTDNPIEFQFSFVNPVTGATEAKDISNDTVKFTARDGYGGAVMIATKTNGPGSHFAPAAGMTRFVLTRTDLTVAGQEANDVFWKYEVRLLEAATGFEIVHFQGELVLNETIGPSA
jgi:hypothetical protein